MNISFQITKRDIEILNFINDFGYVDFTHIMKRFRLKEFNCYKVMKRLKNEGLISYERIYHNLKGFYYVTKQGAEWTELPPIDAIQENKIEHQFKVIEVYLVLRQQFPEATWKTERYLFKDYKKEKKYQHFADGFLEFPDKKPIAIEVELTAKGEDRLRKIFKYYNGEYSIEEVWYYCTQKIINKLKNLAKGNPYIKFFNLDEVLHVK